MTGQPARDRRAATGSQRAPAPAAEGWRVEIPMPVNRNGEPVGWLSLNDHRTHWRERARMAKTWRTAAYKAFERRNLPKGLSHVYITVEFRFLVRRRRDPANLEPTVKPIIDALTPTSTKHAVVKGRTQMSVLLGWGVVEDDDPR